MNARYLKIACILGAISVLLGAYAAHGLKPLLNDDQITTFQTGVRYQFYHTFAIFIAALIGLHYQNQWLARSVWAFIIGIVLFSGSLYLLSCRTLLNIEHWKWLGPLTPLGGLAFIAGWLLLFFAVSKQSNS